MRATCVLLIALTACGGDETTPADAVRAAEVADRMAADPGAAPAILEQAGMDPAQYEALLYEIAADPEATRSYLEARRATFTNPYAPPRPPTRPRGSF